MCVFMNPPFALEELDEHEWWFVETTLESMADGILLLTIVPMSVVSEGGSAEAWKRPLLEHHFVIAAVSLPGELFYPVAVQVVVIILRESVPHRAERPVLQARVISNGHRESKGKHLPVPGVNGLDALKPKLRALIVDPDGSIEGEPVLTKISPLDLSDPVLELAPGVYLGNQVPTFRELQPRLDVQVRENIAALVPLSLKSASIGPKGIVDTAVGFSPISEEFPKRHSKLGECSLNSLSEPEAGDYRNLNSLEGGCSRGFVRGWEQRNCRFLRNSQAYDVYKRDYDCVQWESIDHQAAPL